MAARRSTSFFTWSRRSATVTDRLKPRAVYVARDQADKTAHACARHRSILPLSQGIFSKGSSSIPYRSIQRQTGAIARISERARGVRLYSTRGGVSS